MDAQREEIGTEIDIQVSVTTIQHKTRSVSIKLAAPLTLFTLTDALAQHGAVQSLQEFLSQRIRAEVSDYLARAQEVIAKAADRSRPPKTTK
jgi:hypothetical protein